MIVTFTREWLEGLGYCKLDDNTVASLLGTAHETLEQRVGQVLTDNLQEWQTDEFSALVDGSVDVARSWAAHYGMDPSTDPLHQRLSEEAGPDVAPDEVLREWARVAWLRRNAPDYQLVVRRCFKNLEQELRDARSSILPVLR